MSNHKSCEKRARSSAVKHERNSQYLSSIRTAVKRCRFAIEAVKAGTEKDKGKVTDLFSKAQEMLHKGASKGVLHRKNASRRVSRLASAIKSLSK
ncbi:MAG: 30S ribosomal protein S20 [Proteobacteria bacterium]|nr:30S ribosomal protein S20 [Pseudomonadota bacterium]